MSKEDEKLDFEICGRPVYLSRGAPSLHLLKLYILEKYKYMIEVELTQKLPDQDCFEMWIDLYNKQKLFRKFLPEGFPQIITLVGSSRFMQEHRNEQARLTLDGFIVIPMGMLGHCTPGFDMNGPQKKMLDILHLRKIDISDRIHVVNPICRVCDVCGTIWRHDYVRVEVCSCGAILEYIIPAGYIGDSSKREIEYATRMGKEITWLIPPK